MHILALHGAGLLVATTAVPSSPNLGMAQGQCRPHEAGPAFILQIVGIKDRVGLLRVEVYPSNDADFLQDDNVLVGQGKVFRRVETPVPKTGVIALCIRVPRAGSYAVSVLHDRDSSRKFSVMVDGVGFGGNPRIRLRKPRAAEATIRAGDGPTRRRIILNYHSGFMSFGPIGGR